MSKFELPPMATWLVYTDGVPHAALFGQVADGADIHRPGGSAGRARTRPDPCAGENLREEVGVSRLEGQPGHAKGLGKCSTWNISAKCKVFHVEHFVLANLCVPLCMCNRRNPERISRLSGAVSAESSAIRDPSHSSKTR